MRCCSGQAKARRHGVFLTGSGGGFAAFASAPAGSTGGRAARARTSQGMAALHGGTSSQQLGGKQFRAKHTSKAVDRVAPFAEVLDCFLPVFDICRAPKRCAPHIPCLFVCLFVPARGGKHVVALRGQHMQGALDTDAQARTHAWGP